MLTKNFICEVIDVQAHKAGRIAFESQLFRNKQYEEDAPMSQLLITSYLTDIASNFGETLSRFKYDYDYENQNETVSDLLDKLYTKYISWCEETIASLNELRDQLPELCSDCELIKKFSPESDEFYTRINLNLSPLAFSTRSWIAWPNYINSTLDLLKAAESNNERGCFLMKEE